MSIQLIKKVKVEIPITWTDPPPAPPRGRGASQIVDWGAIFDLLMQHPKRWALVDCIKNGKAAQVRLAGNLKKKYPQLQRPHHWEVVVRGQNELYIRYLGEELPQ